MLHMALKKACFCCLPLRETGSLFPRGCVPFFCEKKGPKKEGQRRRQRWSLRLKKAWFSGLPQNGLSIKGQRLFCGTALLFWFLWKPPRVSGARSGLELPRQERPAAFSRGSSVRLAHGLPKATHLLFLSLPALREAPKPATEPAGVQRGVVCQWQTLNTDRAGRRDCGAPCESLVTFFSEESNSPSRLERQTNYSMNFS